MSVAEEEEEFDYPGQILECEDHLEYWYDGKCVCKSNYFETVEESIEIMQFAIEQFHYFLGHYQEGNTIIFGEYENLYDDEGEVFDEYFQEYYVH